MDILSAARGIAGQITQFVNSVEGFYAGIPFHVVKSGDEFGRRIHRVVMPGQDAARFYDLGQDDGLIRITAYLIGDDHDWRAERLRNALARPGPATLEHPWLGKVQVVPARPGRFEQAHDKGRLTTVELEFWRYSPRPQAQGDTLSDILDWITDTKARVRASLRDMLRPVARGIAIIGAVESFGWAAKGYFTAVLGGTGIISLGASPAVSGLGTIGAITPDAGYADAVADRVIAAPAAIAATSNPVLPAAVGPGDAAARPVAADGRQTAAVLLAAGAMFAAERAAAWPGGALAAMAQACCAADAAGAALDIAFVSDRGAMAWRDRVLAGLDDAAASVAASAGSGGRGAAAQGGMVWQALIALRAAYAADMNARIGRLPRVVTLSLPGPVSVWQIAQYLVGDDPTQLRAAVDDLVARNQIARPWRIEGSVEVLV